MPLPPVSTKALCFQAVHPLVCLFVRTDLVTTISHEGPSSLHETFREYSLAFTDNPIRFWRSKVKVTSGHRGGEASTSMLEHRSLSSSLFILCYDIF